MKKSIFEMTSSLQDGTPIIVSDFKVGGDVWTIDSQGTKVPLMDGDHTLVDGTEFVSVAGKVTEIKPETAVEDTTDAPTEASATPEVKMATQESVDELTRLFGELTEKFNAINIDELVTAKFNELNVPKSILNEVTKPVKLSRQEFILNRLEMFKNK